MKDASATAATAGLYHAAHAQTADTRTACLALIGAAAACHDALRPTMPNGAADMLLDLLSVAGSLLIEDGGGPLDLASPAGRA